MLGPDTLPPAAGERTHGKRFTARGFLPRIALRLAAGMSVLAQMATEPFQPDLPGRPLIRSFANDIAGPR